jgi:uncharacterized damage-inducible protein DinB
MVPSSRNPGPEIYPRSEPPELHKPPEPWLRGTLAEMPAVVRGVLHALELAKEDVGRWGGPLTVEQLETRPLGLPAVAFHIRHIARSLDRLLTYAEGRELSAEQLAELRAEMQPYEARAELFEEFEGALARSAERVAALRDADLEQPRGVGKLRLPSTVGGLLVHVAEHTQRHVGQAVTTAKVVAAG